MRKLLLFLSLSVLIAAPLFAEENMSTAKVWETPMKREDSRYSEKMAEFNKKEAEYRSSAWAKRGALLQKLNALNGRKLSSTDPKEREKMDAELKTVSKQLGDIIEDISKHDVDAAEQAVELAKDRLERAKKSLAFIQEQNKKIAS